MQCGRGGEGEEEGAGQGRTLSTAHTSGVAPGLLEDAESMQSGFQADLAAPAVPPEGCLESVPEDRTGVFPPQTAAAGPAAVKPAPGKTKSGKVRSHAKALTVSGRNLAFAWVLGGLLVCVRGRTQRASKREREERVVLVLWRALAVVLTSTPSVVRTVPVPAGGAQATPAGVEPPGRQARLLPPARQGQHDAAGEQGAERHVRAGVPGCRGGVLALVRT